MLAVTAEASSETAILAACAAFGGLAAAALWRYLANRFGLKVTRWQRLTHALEVTIPNALKELRVDVADVKGQLAAGDTRMGHIEERLDGVERVAENAFTEASAAAEESRGTRVDLGAHMEREEADGARWRTEVREQIDDVRKASVASVARLIEAIESGDKVGRAAEGEHP